MIEKVPIGTSEVFDIGPERNQAPLRFEAAMGLRDSREQHMFCGQMLEEVAGKDDVQGVIREWPRQATVLLQELNFPVEPVFRGWIEVQRLLVCGLDVVYELSIQIGR